MLSSLVKYLFILIVVFGALSARSDLLEDYKSLLNQSEPSLPKEIEYYRNRHFVFVGGFMNELIRKSYFSDNERALKNIGLNYISKIFPSSAYSPLKNADFISEKFIEKYKEGGGNPIIALGHSKGGIEVLLSVLVCPELITNNIIEQVIIVQSPIRGSHMGDQINANLGIFSKLPFLKGGRSLQTEEIDSVIRQKLLALRKDNPELFFEISRRVVFVTSQKNINNLDRVYGQSARFLKYKFKKMNDGLVATEEMWIPGFGVVLGRLPADHTELFVQPTKLLTSGSYDKASSFMYALLKNLDHGKEIKETRIKALSRPKTATLVGFCALALMHIFQ